MAHVAICEHIKENGEPCGSPALTGHVFCYFHQRLREPCHRPGDFEYRLPVLDSSHAILMATQHIAQGVLDSTLEDRRARMLFSGLRLAMSALKQIDKLGTGQNVGTGFQARPGAAEAASEGSPRRQPWVDITQTLRAPEGAADPAAKKPPQSAPLSPTQTILL